MADRNQNRLRKAKAAAKAAKVRERTQVKKL